MKKNFFMMSLALMAVFVVISCSNEEEKDSLSEKESSIEIKVSKTVFRSVNKKLKAKFSVNDTRANSSIISEEEAQEILQPLVEGGEDIREQLIQAIFDGELVVTSEEITELKNMDDSQLAGLAYFTYSLAENVEDEPVDEGIIDEFAIASITKQEVFECMTVAMGLQLVSDLYKYFNGTAQLMTVTEALAIGKAFFKRTSGWVGVAFIVYEYGSCIHEKHKNK